MNYLDNILTPEQKAAHLSLEEDDHNVFLLEKGQISPLAVFNSCTTIEIIRHEADQHLNWKRSGIEFERVN